MQEVDPGTPKSPTEEKQLAFGWKRWLPI